jgi:hypothetical protein
MHYEYPNYYLHPPVASSLSDPNIPLTTLFSNTLNLFFRETKQERISYTSHSVQKAGRI